MFDIDEFIRIYNNGIPAPYLDKLKEASHEELIAFKREVKAHKQRPQEITFATEITPQGPKKLCIHDDVLLRAIRWERFNRSPWQRFLYDLTIPFRQHIGGLWYGADLKETKYLGFVLVGRNSGKTLLEYIGLKMYLIKVGKTVWRYWVGHHWQIITALISLLAIYVTYLSFGSGE